MRPSNSFLTHSRAPAITRTPYAFFSCHTLQIPLRKSWDILPFPYSYSVLFHCCASIRIHYHAALFFLDIYNIFAPLVAPITISHYIYHETFFTPSFPATPSGMSSYHLSLCSNACFLLQSKAISLINNV